MRNLLFSFFIIFSFAIFVSAQINEAKQFDDLGDVNCEELLLHSDLLFNELEKNPTSLAYLIFYEGNHLQSIYNKKTKQYENKYTNPKYGEARNKTKAITFYLNERRKLSKNRIVLIDGGYRQNYSVEIWVAPQNAEPPKPSPSLERKDIKFRKGKAPKTGDCTQEL